LLFYQQAQPRALALRLRALPTNPARGSADELPIPTLQQLCTGAGLGTGLGLGAGVELPTPTLQDSSGAVLPTPTFFTGSLSVVQDVFSFEQPHVI
tara:strand:+ start:353 stop:640 length:288 start_codon:yes stop_codon:yes gene_type:complete